MFSQRHAGGAPKVAGAVTATKGFQAYLYCAWNQTRGLDLFK